MISMSIRNAKMNFSRILALVERGEDVIIRNRQRPVAKISSFKDEKTGDLSLFLSGLSKMRAAQKPAPRGHMEKGIREDRDGRD
jgi:antitoxin (DNA-binding transcriptional repressor) of toxin-antitoxin stability system